MVAFRSSRSKCVTIPNHRSWSFEGCVCFPFFSLFYFFAYLGVFYFIFPKKGYRLASGFGFLRNFVRMGWLLGRLFHLFTGSVSHDIFWGVSGWKKNSWFVFFFSSKYFISLVFTRYLWGKFCRLTFSSFIAAYLLSFPHMVGFRWPTMLYMDGFWC